MRITYQQDGKTVLTKTEADDISEDQIVRLKLTQEETLMFSSDSAVVIQIKVLTDGGDVFVSEPMYVGVGLCIDDEVLV